MRIKISTKVKKNTLMKYLKERLFDIKNIFKRYVIRVAKLKKKVFFVVL